MMSAWTNRQGGTLSRGDCECCRFPGEKPEAMAPIRAGLEAKESSSGIDALIALGSF
jgi:hypothetical protein